MNTEQLLAMGIAEDMAEKVMRLFSGAYIPKGRFNEVNNENKTLRQVLMDKEKTIEALSQEVEEVERLQKSIDKLQADMQLAEKNHQAVIKDKQIDSAVEMALLQAKAIQPQTVRPLLAMDAIDVLEDGTVIGLYEQLTSLQEAEETAFLFAKNNVFDNGLQGFAPAEKQRDVYKNAASSLQEALKHKLIH